MDVSEFRKKYFKCILDKDGNVLFTPYPITASEKQEVATRAAEYYKSMKDAWRAGCGTSEFLDDDLTLSQYTAVICAQDKYGIRYWSKEERLKEIRTKEEVREYWLEQTREVKDGSKIED